MSHVPSKKQEKLFDDVVKAMKKAKAAGLVFYGKSDTLVAYTRSADKYAEDMSSSPFSLIGNRQKAIPHLSKLGVISDSGADDYPCYENEEDAARFSQ